MNSDTFIDAVFSDISQVTGHVIASASIIRTGEILPINDPELEEEMRAASEWLRNMKEEVLAVPESRRIEATARKVREAILRLAEEFEDEVRGN